MRIAVLVVGVFAYNENTLDEIKRCYSLDSENVDLFVYNNNTEADNEQLKEYCRANRIHVIAVKSNQTNPEKKEWGVNDIMRDNWRHFKEVCENENIIHNESLSIHVPLRDPAFFEPSISSPFQYEQVYLALQEVMQYERENGFEYDYIMKIRLDFYLKHDHFGPLHYFNDTNDVLLKSYDNLKYYYDKIDEEDAYHASEYRINNYLWWRTTKFLGGQFILNTSSYDKVASSLGDRDAFNGIIGDAFVITINDACFFSSGKNFKLFMDSLYHHYGEFYDEKCKFWWTAESQLLLSILHSGLHYFDYLQNNNYYKGREMWVNDYHGIEKYDKQQMNTE